MAPNLIQKRFSFFAPTFSRLLPEEGLLLEGKKILSLKAFNGEIAPQDSLNRDQQEGLVKQATVLLGQIYAHRIQKQTLYAAYPLSRLKVLQNRLPLETRKFHTEMLSIFMELRDRHTNYILPEQYRWSAAFLPFLIEEFYDDNFPKDELRNYENRYYLISKICTRKPYIEQGLIENLTAKGLLEPQAGNLVLAPGIIITHWNGMPIDRAVELNANLFAGSNEAARHARSLQNMTIRPLFNVLPPEEEEGVTIEYYNLKTGTSGEFTFQWQIWVSDPPAGVLELETDGGAGLFRREIALGIDTDTELVRRVKRPLFQKDNEPDEQTLIPDVFRWKVLELAGGEKLGYIRIWTFDANYAAILWEFTRIVHTFPEGTQGMIIDVRGNSGGSIQAAVLLLQLLSPGLIRPQYFQFVRTPLALELCRRTRARLSIIRQANQHKWKPWEDEAHSAVENSWTKWADTIATPIGLKNNRYSERIPLVPVEALQYVQQIDPNLGQRYGNRVLLITDALSYSAAEMFAAGFHDNNIGPILGTDGLTGGGGADVWFHHQLGARLAIGAGGAGDASVNDQIATMPKQAPKAPTFSVALRRSIRVCPDVDIPLEDYGVVPDVIHKMTKDDLLARNNVLLNIKAPEILLKSVINRDIVNAFSAAAEDKCAALAAAAGVTVTENDDPYSGPKIDQLPNLSPEEKQAIEAALLDFNSNEDVYTAFKSAAIDLGIHRYWKWMEKAGAGYHGEMSATSRRRSALYTGKPIDELELRHHEKAKVKEKLSVAVASRTVSPTYRNRDIKKAFEQAACNLLMTQAQLDVSDLTCAPQMLYRGTEIDQLPNLTDTQKEMVKRKLPVEKKILARMPTNQEVIDVFSQVGKRARKE